jgi:hypothetical protein
MKRPCKGCGYDRPEATCDLEHRMGCKTQVEGYGHWHPKGTLRIWAENKGGFRMRSREAMGFATWFVSRSVKPLWLGLTVGLVFSMATTDPSDRYYMIMGALYFGFPLVIFVGAYIFARRS